MIFSVLKAASIVAPFACILLIILYWRRAPGAAALALIAAAIAAIGLLIGGGGGIWLAFTASNLRAVLHELTIVNAIRGALGAIAWLLLVIAVFSGRQSSAGKERM